jgi:hypothetical protein
LSIRSSRIRKTIHRKSRGEKAPDPESETLKTGIFPHHNTIIIWRKKAVALYARWLRAYLDFSCQQIACDSLGRHNPSCLRALVPRDTLTHSGSRIVSNKGCSSARRTNIQL